MNYIYGRRTWSWANGPICETYWWAKGPWANGRMRIGRGGERTFYHVGYIQINMNNRIITICFMTSFTTTSNCFTFSREIFQKFFSLGIWLKTCWQKKMYEGETMAGSPSTVIPGLGLVKPVPSSEYSSNIIVKNFPLLGRLHFVKDKNGIMCLAFTFLYWVYGTWCGLWVVLLPHLRDKQTSEPFVGCK